MSEIDAAQNLDINLRRQLTAHHFYNIGKRLHFGGSSFALSIALASPVVLLLKPDWGPMLGALGGLWIFVSRIAFEPFRQEMQLKGATAQELFDCAVLSLSWNDALVRRLSDEEVRKASGSMRGVNSVRSWYPTTNELTWPGSVLLCQRANAVWGRRQHRAYRRVLVVGAVAWAVIGVTVAIVDSASLAQYLTTIALPSLPALLDATEVSGRHDKAALGRQLLENQLDNLLRTGDATETDLREVQDQLFVLRRDAPLVPEWFYRWLRSDYEEDMRYAAGMKVMSMADATPDVRRENNDGPDRQ